MPYHVLARKCSLGMSTVQRVLSGRTDVKLETLAAIAQALGVSLTLEPIRDAEEMRLQQARDRAKQLVALSQGTAALEAQGVNAEAVKRMEEKFVHRLLAGRDGRLWED